MVKQRIILALRSKFPSAASYKVKAGQKARIYLQRKRRWDGPFDGVSVQHEISTLKIGNEAEQFNKSELLLAPYHADEELERVL